MHRKKASFVTNYYEFTVCSSTRGRMLCTTAKGSKLRHQIQQHTEVSRDHLTPEIALHLITPSCELWKCKDQAQVPFSDPYWAFYWPGGQAVARYLLDNPKTVCGFHVLDVGSGSGACAIAAAKAGAQSVTANDIDPVAGEAILLNCSLNQVNVNVSLNDMIGKTCFEWDIILLGDVLYDTEFAQRLQPWIKSLQNAGKTIFVGDPGRHAMNVIPEGNLQLLATYSLPPQTNLENRGFSTAFVWKIL
ncbi:electron transfer flavoprotein beta subunit lysine methyltransferase-like isoform X2 [Schistocerca nitens]|uniref:electron transfer flavoprotein beta subunit lysine methyltransferase-like isoform X2 n=1 Tax=Schistocerca nitens TaxID=7011 RepID=UPI0021199775|nr:electron transfer flavoprotein beta subunit lysine methyltransferase-like isoform X2 [Schistocerca nitens]